MMEIGWEIKNRVMEHLYHLKDSTLDNGKTILNMEKVY